MQANDYGHMSQLDFDLHGLIGIRLLDAAAGDAAAVGRQLGPMQAPLERAPDLVIRFVDRLALATPIRYLGVDEAGFTQDAFLVLRSKHKTHARVLIPMAEVGQRPCEILCERGMPAVPLLIPMLNVVALSKGILPMHASAFRYGGQGVLATGWSKGGKTETLLAFAANQAEYIGDEWVYISDNGSRMHGIPEPIRVWDWHLEDLPESRIQVGRKARARLQLTKLTLRAIEWTAGIGRRTAPGRLLRRMVPLMRNQLHVDVTPEQLFRGEIGPMSSSLDTVLLVMSHSAPEVVVRQIDPQEVAERMVFSLQAERAEFMSWYLKFRFAFPHLRNDLIEQAEERQRELLTQMLASKESYVVYHPYPVAIPSLFEAIHPILQQPAPYRARRATSKVGGAMRGVYPA